MTTRAPQPATTDDDNVAASADAIQPQPDGIAVSPAIGLLPAIYVAQSPNEADTAGRIWHATVRAARQTGGWATRHLPRRGSVGHAAARERTRG